jgi:anti-sigma-K factor RskA
LTNGPHITEEDLELCALGALSDQQAAEALQHVSICEVCAEKLAESRGHVALLAFGVKQEKPSLAVKEKLFAKIAVERAPNSTAIPSAAPLEKKPSTRLWNWWNWGLIPATAALAILSFALWRQNVQLFGELRDAQRVASDLEKERGHVQKLINVLSAPDTITVKLAGTADGTHNSGIVRYNIRSGLLVYTADLPPLPATKVYQLWLVPTGGAPISAGTFVPPAPGQSHLFSSAIPSSSEPKAFAVTIEPAPGVPQPTGPKVLLGAT